MYMIVTINEILDLIRLTTCKTFYKMAKEFMDHAFCVNTVDEQLVLLNKS